MSESKIDQLIAKKKGQIKTKPLVDTETPAVWFHIWQLRAWASVKRIVAIVAGAQSGKTVCGARLLLREIQRTAEPDNPNEDVFNDYLLVGPDTELIKKKARPVLAKLLTGMADYRHVDRCFVFTGEGAKKLVGFECDIKIFIGYASDPDSLEAATYKAIWADECGQNKFLQESWEAIKRRAMRYRARIFLTTTPYAVTGWLRTLCDEADLNPDGDCEVIRFKTEDNPVVDKEEIENARLSMPEWRFRLFYLGEFTRPAGAIYDCFEEYHKVPAFSVPDSWPRYLGTDFGEVNTAAVYLAEDPDGRLYAYSEYHTGGKSVEEHVKALKAKDETKRTVGGTWTGEDPGWRREFVAAGLQIEKPPIKEVEPGIDRVYRQFKLNRLYIMDSCPRLIKQIESYSREVDENGEPTEKIEDKAKFHLADALRYIIAALRPMDGEERVIDRIKKREEKMEPQPMQIEQFRTNTWVMEQESLKKPTLGLKQVRVV